jgi:hypothetical protein
MQLLFHKIPSEIFNIFMLKSIHKTNKKYFHYRFHDVIKMSFKLLYGDNIKLSHKVFLEMEFS